MPVAIIAITQLRVSRRKARSMPKMGIQGTETSSGVSASAPGSRVASQTVDAPGASARRKNALRPIARTRTGPTRAATRWARSIVYIQSPSMGSGAGKGPRVFYGSGEGFPEDQSAAVGDVPPALLRRVRAWPSPRTPRPSVFRPAPPGPSLAAPGRRLLRPVGRGDVGLQLRDPHLRVPDLCRQRGRVRGRGRWGGRQGGPGPRLAGADHLAVHPPGRG